MKKLFALTLLSLFASGGAFAAANETANPQQDKMKACNTKAADMKGDDRKAFMKTCLSAKPEKKESKMAMCNKKTAGMTKDDRAKAQSDCMKAS
jgi:hypothetical protein